MKGFAILLISCVVVTKVSMAQNSYFGFEWARSLTGKNNDGAVAVATDRAGNVFVAGNFTDTLDANPDTSVFAPLVSAGSGDCFVAKLNTSGQLIWALRLGGKEQDVLKSLHIDPSGNVLFTGLFRDTVDFDPGTGVYALVAPATLSDMFIVKVSGTGQFRWAKAFGAPAYESESCEDVTTDSVGNVYTVGYFAHAVDFNPDSGQSVLIPGGSVDAFVQKLDSNGGFLLAANAGQDKRAHAVTVTGAGNIAYAGAGLGGINGNQLRVAMLRPNGTTLWSREHGAANYDMASDLCADVSGNLYITGRFNGSVSFGTGWTLSNAADAPFLWKLSATGVTVWVHEVSGPWSSSKTASGNAISLAGSRVHVAGTGYTVNTQNGFIARYDTSGVKLFATTFESTQYENTAEDVATDSLGNFYVAGGFARTIDFCPGNDTYLLTAGGTLGFNDPMLVKFHPCMPTSDTLAVTTCGSYTSPWGSLLQSSGTYTGIIRNAGGCDSIIVLHLVVNASFVFSTIYPTACDSFVLPSGKVVYVPGMYYDTLQRVNGCDSIYAFQLTVNYSSTLAPVVHSCGPYTTGSNTFTTSGVYVLHLASASGCDSTVTLNLTVTTLNPAVTQSGSVLTAQDTGVAYQWLRCDQAYALQPGATQQSFTPVTSGSYAVRISGNGCSDTSACFSIVFTGAGQQHTASQFRLYPNPSSGEMYIQVGAKPAGFLHVEVTDFSGRCVFSGETDERVFALPVVLARGFYTVAVTGQGCRYTAKLIRQ